MQTIRLQPHYAEAYSDLGQIYYDRKEYDKAIYYFKKFIQLNPNDANIYYNLGDVYIGKGDKENVLKQIIKLEELKRNDLVNSLKQEIDLIIEK